MARVTNRQKYSSTFVYNVYQLAFICIFGFCAYNALDVPDDMGRDFTVLVNMLPPMNPSTAHVMSIFIPAFYIACAFVRMFGPMYVVYRVMDKATTIEQCRVSFSHQFYKRVVKSPIPFLDGLWDAAMLPLLKFAERKVKTFGRNVVYPRVFKKKNH